MAAYLRGIGGALGAKPRAVLVISAHWEAPVATLNSGERPPLLFDYYGFPPHTYQLQYPAAGAPDLVPQVRTLLAAAGFQSAADASRGFDHGVFIPFMLVYPQADVPILQLSLLEGLDPERHLALGRALAPLREQGVLIVGTGMSYHNLGKMFSGTADAEARAFDDWLDAAVGGSATREQQLIAWKRAPGAAAAHPREEHLLPLMVAAGAAPGEAARRNYHETLLGKPIAGFQFG